MPMKPRASTKSTKSTNPKTTGKHPKEGAGRRPAPARAHRDDTPEAKTQRSRTAKTHPTRNSHGAARKDKPAKSRRP